MLIDLDVDYNGFLSRVDTGRYLLLDHMVRYYLLEANGWEDNNMFWPEYNLPTGVERLRAGVKAMKEGTWFETHGSCDSPDQFLTTETGQRIQNSPWTFLIVFKHMTQKDHGGMRWHKNGTHIGLKRPQYEYFEDETEITEIYNFNVYRKLGKAGETYRTLKTLCG